MEKTANELVDRGHVGLIGQWVALSTGLVSRAVGTSFGILQDVRAELAERIVATIDWVDGSQQGTLRLVRSIHRRVDAFSKEALEAGEHALSGVVRGVQATSDEATRFAARAANVLVETPAPN
jgi:hypothetical protein